MPLLTAAVIGPSAWILDSASQPRALAWSVLIVGVFSFMTATGALLTATLPEPGAGLEGVARVGLALGFLLGIGAGFVLWLYVAVGTYLTLKVISRPPSLANLVRLTGISLIFPTAGRAVSLGVQALPPGWLPTAAYLLGVAWGTAVLSRAIATSTETRWLTAALGVLVPVSATQVPLLAARLL